MSGHWEVSGTERGMIPRLVNLALATSIRIEERDREAVVVAYFGPEDTAGVYLARGENLDTAKLQLAAIHARLVFLQPLVYDAHGTKGGQDR